MNTEPPHPSQGCLDLGSRLQRMSGLLTFGAVAGMSSVSAETWTALSLNPKPSKPEALQSPKTPKNPSSPNPPRDHGGRGPLRSSHRALPPEPAGSSSGGPGA